MIEIITKILGQKTSRNDLAELEKNARKSGYIILANNLKNLLTNRPGVAYFVIEEIDDSNLLDADSLNGIDQDDFDFENLSGTSSASIYKEITNIIVKTIEKDPGKLIWEQPWDGGHKYGRVLNYVSKKPYRGINALLLEVIYPQHYGKNWDVPYFMTAAQVESKKGKIKPGSKSYPVVFYSIGYRYQDKKSGINIVSNKKADFISKIAAVKNKIWEFKNGSKLTLDMFAELHKFSMLRKYEVYNGEDIDGIDWKIQEITIENDFSPIETAEIILDHMPKKPRINFAGDSAFYSPSKDYVNMPAKGSFKSEAKYYATLFHELIHSTGHENRVGRSMKGKFGSEEYAFEELIAELGASFITAEAGILNHHVKNTAAYIEGWNKRLVAKLKDDKTFIFRASGAAQKAADFILDVNKKGVPKYRKNLIVESSKPKTTVVRKALKKDKSEPKKNRPSVKPTKTKVDKKGQYSLFGTADSKESIAFNKKILGAKKNGFKRNEVFQLGATKGNLLNTIGKFNMSISSGVIKKAMTKDDAHVAEWHHFINLPDNINNPVAIFESKTKGEGYVVLTELKNVKSKPLILAVHVSHNFQILKVASIYAKTKLSIYSTWIKEGFLLYGNQKSELFNYITAPIAESSKSSPENKVKQKRITSKKSLGTVIENVICEPETRVKSQIKKVSSSSSKQESIFKRPGDKVEEIATFRLSGEIGKFLQNLQKYRLAILLKGDPHAGKTQFAWQLIDAFIEGGFTTAVFDLEQGGLASKDTELAMQRNVEPEHQKQLLVAGEAPKGIETIRQFANDFDVIMIDSWQKLKIPNNRLDDLRNEFPNTIFILIFQQNAEGGTRGGVTADYDVPVAIKVHKVDSTFVNNYAELLKNRGNQIGLKYNVASKSIMLEE